MSIETKRLELAVSMSQRKSGSFAKRPKTVRVSSRDLLDEAADDEHTPDEMESYLSGGMNSERGQEGL